MNLTEFYPTPDRLISKMLLGLEIHTISTVLEPSAGKGDIAKATADRFNAFGRFSRDNKAVIDCIEIDSHLRHILKGENFRVVHDDFLTYQTGKRYDLIIMNPPFSDGDKHLTKALDMQQYGGQIRCLLNAETIRNPYSNPRKALVRRLEKLGAKIEYLQGEFESAERKTSVEVALISVDIPNSLPDSLILDGLHRAKEQADSERGPDAVAHVDFIEAIVEKYRFEVAAGLRLIAEYKALKPYLLETLNKDNKSDSAILDLALHNHDRSRSHASIENEYVRAVRFKYWEALFESPKFTSQLTGNLRTELHSRVKELEDYEFSAVNIAEIRRQLSLQTISSIEDTILKLFDKLSYQHAWHDNYKTNIHYFDGWATNKAYKINEKVIIPLSAFSDWNDEFIPTRYQVEEQLSVLLCANRH